MQSLVWYYGVVWLDSVGGFSFQMKGGKMYDLKLGQINHSLIKALKVLVACKRMVGRRSEVWDDLVDTEREIRESAGECQRVLKLIEVDEVRPLISG